MISSPPSTSRLEPGGSNDALLVASLLNAADAAALDEGVLNCVYAAIDTVFWKSV
jgi:hypothetical protein